MPLILAIEPDQEQAARLGDLIRARVRAELVHVPTTERALAAIGDRVPDLVLVPSLLSPQEDAALAGALRIIATAAHVRMLTIPVLAPLLEDTNKRGVLQKWRRRSESKPAAGCDPSVFAEQIKTYLDEAEAERAADAEFEIGGQLFESSIPAMMTAADEPLAASSAVAQAVVEIELQKAAESAADAVIVTEFVNATDPRIEAQAETEAQAATVAVAPDAETALAANAIETDSAIEEQFVLGDAPVETTAAIEADSVIEWEAVIEAGVTVEAGNPIDAEAAIEAEAATESEALTQPEAVIEWNAVVELAEAEFEVAAATEIDADIAAEVVAAIPVEGEPAAIEVDEPGLQLAWEDLSPSDDLEFVALEQTLGLVPPPPSTETIAASPEPDVNPEIRADLIARVDAVVSRVIKNLRAARAAQAARPVTKENEPEPASINQPVVDERRVMTESTPVVVAPLSEASTSDTPAIATHAAAIEPMAAATAIESAAIESAAIESTTEPAPVDVAATEPAPVEVAAAESAAIPAVSPAAVPPATEKKAGRGRQQPNHGWVALVDALRRDLEQQRQQEQKKKQQQTPAPAPPVALPGVVVSAAETPAPALAAEPPAPALVVEPPAPALAAEAEAPALATEPSQRRPRKRRPSPPKPKVVTVPARPASQRPAQDEWGLFDPNQCGFAALLAKLDEITETENKAST